MTIWQIMNNRIKLTNHNNFQKNSHNQKQLKKKKRYQHFLQKSSSQNNRLIYLKNLKLMLQDKETPTFFIWSYFIYHSVVHNYKDVFYVNYLIDNNSICRYDWYN